MTTTGHQGSARAPLSHCHTGTWRAPIRRALGFVALVLCVLLAPALGADQAFANAKYAAIVLDADTGDVLYSSRADSRRFPASLTKMMTLYKLFEALENGQLNLESRLSVSAHAAGQPPSKLGLSAGSTIKVEDAIQALVVRSANDVAVVVAEALGGTEWSFAQIMTDQAKRLGMTRTIFRNASGLPNSDQVTTARDMSILARRLQMDFPQYFPYFASKSLQWHGRVYKTHNHLVGNVAGVDGMKTGYTAASGFNLVTTAERKGRRIVAVVLGGRTAQTRDAHMKALIEENFARIAKENPAIAEVIPEPRARPARLAELDPPIVPRPKPGREQTAFADVMVAPLPEGDGTAAAAAIEVAALPGVEVDEEPSNDQANALAPRPKPTRSIAQSSDPLDTSIASLIVSSDRAGPGPAPERTARWGIQIGAYVSPESAASRLEAAREALPEVLGEAAQLILEVSVDDTSFYRARFGPFQAEEADHACAALVPHGFKCFKVPEGIGAEFQTAGSPAR